MDRDGVVYRWECLPEYIATQQYSRCLGRIFASLPRRVRRRAVGPMTRAALLIGNGIAGFNAELQPDESLTEAERETFREAALAGIECSREGLQMLGQVPRASRSDLLMADELLERIESGVRGAEIRPAWL